MLELFRSKRRALLWIAEGALIVLSIFAAAVLRLGWLDASGQVGSLLARSVFASLIVQASIYYHGLYADEPTRSKGGLVVNVVRSLAVGFLVLWLLYYVVPQAKLGRGVSLPALGLTAVALPTFRLLHQLFSRIPRFSRRTIILGDGALAREIALLIGSRPLGLSLVGLLAQQGASGSAAPGTIGTYEDLLSLASRHKVELVIVAYRDRRGTLPVDQLLALKFEGVSVVEGVDFYERTTGKIYVQEIRPSQFIFGDGFSYGKNAKRLKRIFDVVISSIVLVIALPVMLVVGLFIKLDSDGPILYKQVRLGELGREFTILKFRSMYDNAERSGAQWAKEVDDRVTRVGRVLRKTRLDELPQLWNVLRGDMSLVGPRPERPVFVAELERQVPFFRQRLCVKPGITGHAQVRCRYAASIEDSLEKLQYDLYYIKSFSVFFDLSVLFDTLKVVVLKIGAR